MAFLTILYADKITLYADCDQASNLWQHLKLPSELESELQDTVDWGRMWLDFIPRRTQLISIDWSNNFGGSNVKIFLF